MDGFPPYDVQVTRSKWFAWAVTAAAFALVLSLFAAGGKVPSLSVFLLWIGLLMASQLLSVSLGSAAGVTMAFPIHLALAILFHKEPYVALVIAGLGAVDIEEFKLEIPLHKALFNRAVGIFSVAAAIVPFALQGVLGDAFQPLPVILSAILHLVTNLALISVALYLERGIPLTDAIRLLVPRPVGGFAVSYALLTGLGVATALAYTRVEGGGGWAVAAILIPLLFARLGIVGARAQQELSDRLRRQQQALLEATEKLFHEREDERKRIAADMHDTSLQSLAAAAYGCGNAADFLRTGDRERAQQAVGAAHNAVMGAMTELRRSLVDLRGPALQGGLSQSVGSLADQMSTLWGVPIQINSNLSKEPPIPVALAVYQILQEGVTNAIKHSQSSSIDVHIEDGDGMVHVVVKDNGTGFVPSLKPGEDHVGMKIMEERAAQVGGWIEVESQLGRGTRLEAVIPSGHR